MIQMVLKSAQILLHKYPLRSSTEFSQPLYKYTIPHAVIPFLDLTHIWAITGTQFNFFHNNGDIVHYEAIMNPLFSIVKT